MLEFFFPEWFLCFHPDEGRKISYSKSDTKLTYVTGIKFSWKAFQNVIYVTVIGLLSRCLLCLSSLPLTNLPKYWKDFLSSNIAKFLFVEGIHWVKSCTEGTFTCDDFCIPQQQICDQISDCIDGSDEQNCSMGFFFWI